MKSFILASLFVFSSAVMAKTPATTAVAKLLPAGDYVGNDCNVSLKVKTDYVSISITNTETTKLFTILDSGINYNVDETTGEVMASQTIRFPHSLGGGSKVFSIRNVSDSEVELYIAETILDHHGNDTTTYTACTVTK